MPHDRSNVMIIKSTHPFPTETCKISHESHPDTQMGIIRKNWRCNRSTTNHIQVVPTTMEKDAYISNCTVYNWLCCEVDEKSVTGRLRRQQDWCRIVFKHTNQRTSISKHVCSSKFYLWMLMGACSRYLFWIHVYFLALVVGLSTILLAAHLKGTNTAINYTHNVILITLTKRDLRKFL